jgi:hypothetical protein
MAFRTQKISQMTPKGADLEATDLIEVSTIESGSYVTRSITGQELIDAIPLPPSGLTVGTTPISSGTIGRVLFQGTGNVLQQSSSLFWDSTNNRLGIGTATPTRTLSVIGSATSGFDAISFKGQYTKVGYLANDNAGVYLASGAGVTESYIGLTATALTLQAASAFIDFRVGASRGVIYSTGNWFIGPSATDAGFRLDVNGTARVRGTGTTSATTSFQVVNSAGSLSFRVDDNADVRIARDIAAFIRSYSTASGASFPSYSFSGNSSAGLYQDGVNIIGIATGGTSRLQIANTGNVLINTTTDAGFRLDVNGTARVSSSFQSNGNVIFGTSNGFYWDSANQRLGLGTNTPQVVFHIQTGTSEKLRLETSGTIGNFVTFYNSGVRKGYLGRSSSNDDLVYFNESATGNLIFGSNGIERMRIKSNGVINMSAIPTSPLGLSAGDIWNDGGTLKIV